jgi:nucleoside-diphosphate-sugar epimerase
MITGADGFIGRTLAARLRATGTEVVGVDLVADVGAGIVAGDISVPGPWQRAAEGCDALVHTAALVGMPTDVSKFWAVNVRGTRLAIEAARDHGVARVVHVSSVVTFGLDFPNDVDETFPVRPTGVAYTDTKIASEQVALMAHAAGEQETVVIRPGDVYGPASVPWVLLPLKLMRERRLVIPGGGRGVHSPVYIDDLVDGLARSLTAPGAAGRVITLSGGQGVQVGAYMNHLARMIGARVPSVPTAVALAGAAALDRLARIRRGDNELTPDAVRYLAHRRGTYGIGTAHALLGWSPKVGLQDGMERTEQWLHDEGLIRA